MFLREKVFPGYEATVWRQILSQFKSRLLSSVVVVWWTVVSAHYNRPSVLAYGAKTLQPLRWETGDEITLENFLEFIDEPILNNLSQRRNCIQSCPTYSARLLLLQSELCVLINSSVNGSPMSVTVLSVACVCCFSVDVG